MASNIYYIHLNETKSTAVTARNPLYAQSYRHDSTHQLWNISWKEKRLNESTRKDRSDDLLHNK